MKAHELKACLALAQSGLELQADDSVLYGFGLPDFQPVFVTMAVVAKCIRWQCNQWDGGFDWEQYQKDRPFYLRNVHLDEMTAKAACDWVTAKAVMVLAQE